MFKSIRKHRHCPARATSDNDFPDCDQWACCRALACVRDAPGPQDEAMKILLAGTLLLPISAGAEAFVEAVGTALIRGLENTCPAWSPVGR